ncbi:MAG: hypothetical protein VXZ72_02325 [Chlamydiota bacterium]|nr:hypothetical protein [Chlamydiota bacterium]
MSNKKDTIDYDEVMRRVKSGESPLKIADELQVHRGALYRRLRKMGERRTPKKFIR